MDYSCVLDKANKPSPRVFFGPDGHPYISDQLGLRRATALALALLALKPTQRISGYREVGNE